LQYLQYSRRPPKSRKLKAVLKNHLIWREGALGFLTAWRALNVYAQNTKESSFVFCCFSAKQFPKICLLCGLAGLQYLQYSRRPP
jgi:hypothetical protein